MNKNNETDLAGYIHSNYARLRKVKKALQGVAINTNKTKPREWASNSIRTWLGKDELGKQLRTMLLTCTDESYSNFEDNKFCKKYIRNDVGFKYFCSIVDGKTSISYENFLVMMEDVDFKVGVDEQTRKKDYEMVSQIMAREHETELAKKKFKMKRVGDREYHPIQNMKKSIRNQFLVEHGLPYDYDIQAAAPTLLYEHAIRCGMKRKLKHIKTLVDDPAAARYNLWSELNARVRSIKLHNEENVDKANNITKKVTEFTFSEVKKIITALFCGARVCYKTGHYQNYALSQMLENNQMKMIVLDGSVYISQLRKEIGHMWSAIKKHETHRATLGGRNLPLTSKQKWGIYFRLENEVMTAVKGALERHNIKYLTIHDGMQTNKPIDTMWLADEVFMDTGYKINFATDVDNDDGDDLIIDDDYETPAIQMVEFDSIFKDDVTEDEEEN